MIQITSKTSCESPSHIVKCSKTSDSAFVLSLKNRTYTKYTWNSNTDEEDEKIQEVNTNLPDCPEINLTITGKIRRKLVHIYLCEKIVSFEDEVYLDIPNAIFLQRVSSQTKTFDMVCFYGKKFEMISIVDKSDLDIIRKWYPNKIFSCGADPLPMKSVTEYLEKVQGDDMYEKVFAELYAASESSCSEYEAESSDTDDDYISDEDDEIQPEETDYDSEEYYTEEDDYDKRPSKKAKT